MDRLIRMEPSNQVAVRVEPGQRCSGQLTLRNVMYTMPVAFRLLSRNRARFTIRPQTGIIAPLAALKVEITYLPPALPAPLLPDTSPECNETFILDSVVSPGAAFKEGASAAALDAVPADWFTTKKKLVFTDSGIRVFFAGSSVVTRLIESGDMEKLREVLERSDPEWRAADSVDTGGRPLLHIAIALRRPELVQLICEFGADVEARDAAGWSPLEAAAAAGESVIAELLMARGASTERSPGSARGPLHHAAAGGHAELLQLLLLKDAAADGETADGRTALHLAAAERRRECVQILLAAGARTDACGGSATDTPLHVAAAAGDEPTARMLIASGCVGLREARNGAGKTAYDIAAAKGHRRLFGLLRADERLAAGARKGEVREVERAIEIGAAADARDGWGWTALMRAGFKGNVEVIRVLLEKGASVVARDDDGYTALHCAAEGGQAEAVEVLVKRGADVESRTKKGRTAAEISAALGYATIVRMLEQGGPTEKEMEARRPPVPPAVTGKGKKKGSRIVAGGNVGGGMKVGFAGREAAMAVASC